MTKKEKQLLLIDLCGRLPYGVKLDNGLKLRSIDVLTGVISCSGSDRKIDCIKPYLRPMSSMTEEEKAFVYNGHIEFWVREDYCNKHHLDCWGLIEKGLALEAKPEMYKI